MSSIIRFIESFEKFVGAVGRWQGAPELTACVPITIDSTPIGAADTPVAPLAPPAPPTLADIKRMKRELDHHPVPQCKRMREKLNTKRQAYTDAMAAFRAQRTQA